MKILHINTQDTGGAGKACLRLSTAINDLGFISNLLVLRKTLKSKNIFKYKPTKKEVMLNFIMRIINKIKLSNLNIEKGETFSFINSGFKVEKTILYNESNIINLHWTASFLDYKTFFKDNNKKIIWTLHDMEPFSGGNHYTKIDKVSSTEKKILKNKLEIFKKNNINLTIVSPSKWLMNKSKESELFKDFPHFCIPNGIDSNIYKNIDSSIVRKELHLPPNKKIILFVAESVQNKRKGFQFLVKALEKIKYNQDNILLCTVGSINTDTLSSFNNIHNFGYIKNEEEMVKIYSCADIFVIPSIEDNLPNTMIESLMCGTPVVGFKIGGISETINTGENGVLCEKIDSNELSKSISRALEINFNKKNIRENTMKKYDSKIIANEYIKLYQKIITSK